MEKKHFLWFLIFAVVVVIVDAIIQQIMLLRNVKKGKSPSIGDYDIIVPAILYGISIKIGIKDKCLFLINGSRCVPININDFVSIKHIKNNKYIFRLDNARAIGSKMFSLKFESEELHQYLSNLIVEPYAPKSIKDFWDIPQVRFIALAIAYAAFCAIFTWIDQMEVFLIITVILIIGAGIYIVFDSIRHRMTNALLTGKEKREENDHRKKIYANILAICLAVAIVLTLLAMVIPDAPSRIGEICGACGGSGKFQGKECPACHGFGVYVD